jgi:hypothetical protein
MVCKYDEAAEEERRIEKFYCSPSQKRGMSMRKALTNEAVGRQKGETPALHSCCPPYYHVKYVSSA